MNLGIWRVQDPFSVGRFRCYLYASCVDLPDSRPTADAKVVLWLCTPTYIQQDYPFDVVINIYTYGTNVELLLNTKRTADAGIPIGMPCHAMPSTMTWHGIR